MYFNKISLKPLKKPPAEIKVKAKIVNDDDRNQYISKLKKEYEMKLLNQKNVYESQLENQKNQLIEQLNNHIREFKKIEQEQAQEIQKLKKQISQMKTKEEKSQKLSNDKNENIEMKILSWETIQELENLEDIGYGNSSRVFKVAMKKIYALKVMNITEMNYLRLKNFFKEYEIINSLNHPNIIKSYGIFLSNETNPPSILLEFCSLNLMKGIIEKHLNRIQIAFAVYQIAEGMKYIHFRKIIHRDLKPSNILIADDGTMKISDFGISKLVCDDDISMTTAIGTSKFMAPEMINEDKNYTEKVDVYSFGVLIYFILSGGKLPNISLGDVSKGNKAPIPVIFTSFAKKLINDCWNFDSKTRPSFKSICEQLCQPNNKLLNFTNSENNELHLCISRHKEKIPLYFE